MNLVSRRATIKLKSDDKRIAIGGRAQVRSRLQQVRALLRVSFRSSLLAYARGTMLTRMHTPMNVSWGGVAVGYTSESRYGARDIQVYPKIYQTVVLRLPYITSHAVGSQRSPRPTCVQLEPSLSLPRQTERKKVSKRSHRLRVVASIPGADFICRMSTSRRRGGSRERGHRM